MESKKAYPLWEETKKKYVADIWLAQEKLVRYQSKHNQRDLEDLQDACLRCWMNIRSYRDLLVKKKHAHNKPMVDKMEAMMLEMPKQDYKSWARTWMFLNDSYKRLGIDDVGKAEDDEEDYAKMMMEGYFDND